MLAAKALGFGSNWKTGAPAYHPIVRNGLGFGDDVAIIGFFYIGTEPKPSPLQRASIDSVVRYWAAYAAAVLFGEAVRGATRVCAAPDRVPGFGPGRWIIRLLPCTVTGTSGM